jgi:hypothetical protein
LMKGEDIAHEKPGALLLMQDQKVVQTCSSHAPQKAFTHGIRAARVRYGVRSTLMPLAVATRAKLGPNLQSVSQMRYFGACPYGVASRSGTRYPVIGRRACHIHMDDFPRFQFNDEEGKQLTEEEVCHLQAHHRPPPPTPLPHECAGMSSNSGFELEMARICLIYF